MKKKDTQQIIAEVLNFQVTASILDHVSDLVWIKDKNGTYIAVSDSFSTLFGLPEDHITGKTDMEIPLDSLVDTLDDQYVIDNCETTISQKSHSLNGETRYFEVRKSPTLDAHGNVIGIVAIGRDITEIVRRQEYLRYLGYHDMLTKLYNRNYFEQLPEELDRENVQVLGIVICDIDGLKLVNDTMGHTAGDERLIIAADILKQAVGACGKLARIGGDEFVIVVPNASQAVIDEIILRMKSLLVKQNCDKDSLPLNISFGVAVGDLSVTNFFNLFKDADNSMYRDKMLHTESTRNVLVKTIIKMLTMKDYIAQGHADRLQEYAAAIGKKAGLPEGKLNDLRLLAEFHDIGKIGIPDYILKKPGPLSPEEMSLMRRHPEIGFQLSKSIPELTPIADCILKHHEWWDGSGYPFGLKGEGIPIEARIVNIADAYDAMTHDRPYRNALPREKALGELKKCAGTQFDPELVKISVDLFNDAAPTQ